MLAVSDALHAVLRAASTMRTMTESNTPRNAAEERVHQFMIEFDAQWHLAAPSFENRDPENPRAAFALWRELMGQTAENHFAYSSTVGLAQSFGRPPSYGPQAEVLIGSEIHGDVAYVQTRGTSPLEKIHEYTLLLQGEEWRITAIDDHYKDPSLPFMERDVQDERLSRCSPEAALTEMPAAQAQLDEVRNFTEREVSGPQEGESSQVTGSEIGTLTTTSGALAVLDFGYDNDDAHPLARTVAPGSYPVDRVTAAGRNAAVRVRFTQEAPVSWHPASLPGGGHVMGVDAGCICIMDYVAYTAMTRREKAAAFGRFGGMSRPAAAEIPLDGTDVGIAADSGYGDGSYPAYWGIDAQGRTAQLIVDFLTLVDQDDDGVLTHR